MSVRNHLYVGPYVECTYRDEKRTILIFGCTNATCKEHPKNVRKYATGAFCSTCGSPNGQIPIEVPVWPDAAEITNEALSVMNGAAGQPSLFLRPNVSRPGEPRPNLRLDDELHLSLEAPLVDPEREMAWFKDVFARELRDLEKAYAVVTVKWGVHQYFG